MSQRLREILVQKLGLLVDETRLATVLERRVAARRCTEESYLQSLSREEMGALAREVTVTETYFFRHFSQLRAYAERALPERAARGSRPVRVLSAGCASGEEAYSLAILARESGWEACVRGVDVNPAMLERAAANRFSLWSLRETPEDLKRRWFRFEGREARLEPSLWSSVRLAQRNLVEDDPDLWAPNSYDIVFCRNVLMYFEPEQARAVVERIARALAPGGFLFLGHAETLRALSQDFHLHHSHETFYYERKAERAALPGDWTEEIRLATERVCALSDRVRHRPDGSDNLARALDLLQQERFGEAIELLPEPARDPDQRLLRAALLTHSGQLEQAEECCLGLLEEDELCAGAHYLLAVCRAESGDRAAAVRHDQTATYLDPGFAMPHLHLGLLSRDRRELERAITLLEREDASRLLLYGGGFGRQALISMCRTHLERL